MSSQSSLSAHPGLRIVPDLPEVSPRLRGLAARRLMVGARLGVDAAMVAASLATAVWKASLSSSKALATRRWS